MINLNHRLKIFTALLFFTFSSGCSAISHGIAMLRSTEHFSISQVDDRILFEKGAEDISKKIEYYINYAISVTENNQHLKFKQKIEILRCGTPKSFSYFTSSGKAIRGKAFDGKVFLSAKWLREKTESI